MHLRLLCDWALENLLYLMVILALQLSGRDFSLRECPYLRNYLYSKLFLCSGKWWHIRMLRRMPIME